MEERCERFEGLASARNDFAAIALNIGLGAPPVVLPLEQISSGPSPTKHFEIIATEIHRSAAAPKDSEWLYTEPCWRVQMELRGDLT